MRRESRSEREAWTAHIDGTSASKPNKYGAERSGKYASKHEERVAANLHMLAGKGLIKDVREQVRFVLVPGNRRLRPVVYVADFTWIDVDGQMTVGDAKGFKTPVYRLKRRMMALLHGIDIVEL